MPYTHTADCSQSADDCKCPPAPAAEASGTMTPAQAGLYLARVPVGMLASGDIVISVGRALHLDQRTGHMLGYDHWTYAAYGPDGKRLGTTRLRQDAEVNVIRQAAV
jgi:hypothetical protein